MISKNRLLVCSLVSTSAIFQVSADDWARFRGPNGTGIAQTNPIPLKWTEKDILFKAELPGVGHSSPIVVNNRVILLSATDKDRLILCLDGTTGKTIWTSKVPGGPAKIHRKSSFASSTPCSDGKHVYCVFWDGQNVGLFSYDLSGKLLWKTDFGKFASQHGPGFSPIVVDGKVIVNNDQDGSAMLQAFDAGTGKMLWEVERKAFRACYSTPFLVEQNGVKQLLVTSTAGINAYDLTNGKEYWNYTWSFPGMALRTVASSVADGNLVFACAGDGSGARSMVAVKLGGKGDITTTNLAWEKTGGTPYVPTLVTYQGHLYGVLDTGMAISIDQKSGKETILGRLAGNVSASPVLINGNVLVADEKGDAFVFAANPNKLKVLAKNKLGELIMATPAVANGKIYLRGEKNLICIGAKKSNLKP